MHKLLGRIPNQKYFFMITEKLIRATLPYVLCVIFFFVGVYYQSNKDKPIMKDYESKVELQKAELDNLRISHELEKKKIEIEFITKQNFIQDATPREIDSLWGAFGF